MITFASAVKIELWLRMDIPLIWWDIDRLYLRTTNFFPAEIYRPVFEVEVKACQFFL